MCKLVSNDYGDWFVIPANKTAAWQLWLESPAADYGMEPPSWAKKVDGPHTVQFKEWKETK